MEIYGELEPARDKDIIIRRVEELSLRFRRVDIPDVPLGKPSISSPVLSLYIHSTFKIPVIAHIRTKDHNVVSLKSIIKTLVYFGVKDQLYLKGDIPQQGDFCNDSWNPEDAVDYGEKYNVKTGLLLSLRKPLELIQKRLSVRASYYYLTRIEDKESILEKVSKIVNIASNQGSKLASYIVIGGKLNKEYLARYQIPFVELENVPRLLDKLERMNIERFIISSPGGYPHLMEASYLLASLGLL